MKCRLGFVSNSSTTAFIFLTTPENHARALEGLSAYERAVVEQVVTSFSLGGQEFIKHTDIVTDYGSYTFEEFYLSAKDVEDEDRPSDAFDKYEAIAKEKPELVHSWREG